MLNCSRSEFTEKTRWQREHWNCRLHSKTFTVVALVTVPDGGVVLCIDLPYMEPRMGIGVYIYTGIPDTASSLPMS